MRWKCTFAETSVWLNVCASTERPSPPTPVILRWEREGLHARASGVRWPSLNCAACSSVITTETWTASSERWVLRNACSILSQILSIWIPQWYFTSNWNGKFACLLRLGTILWPRVYYNKPQMTNVQCRSAATCPSVSVTSTLVILLYNDKFMAILTDVKGDRHHELQCLLKAQAFMNCPINEMG